MRKKNAIRIALAGNPNCGKTTMFNRLTGSNQYVGNWPGVTVEKKEGPLRHHPDVMVVDLPGIYSLSPYTMEEVVTRNFLLQDSPDVILNLVDASNLERNLYLTTQLLEMGIPMVVALNMMDVVEKRGDTIDSKQLSAQLGCPVVEMSAVRGKGSQEAVEQAIQAAKNATIPLPQQDVFSGDIEEAVREIASLYEKETSGVHTRWFAVKLLEQDAKVLEQVVLTENTRKQIAAWSEHVQNKHDRDPESIITKQRYQSISSLVHRCLKRKQEGLNWSDRIDRIVTNPWLGIPILIVVIWGIYFIAVSWLGPMLVDWTNDFLIADIIQGNLRSWMQSIHTADWLISLLVDGIIGGVGAVIGFVPQIAILFFLMSVLEDCGYMSRVAFIMNRVLRKFGLSGKAFIPLLVSSGCGVPGIMATRTMENDRDRRMTIMLTTFIPCSAKMPIIALMAGAIFRGDSIAHSLVAPSMYFAGVIMVIVCGALLKKTKLFAGDPAPFVMELPQYHIPRFAGVMRHMWERVRSFIIKAGTVIFISCAGIWFLSNFNWSFQMCDTSQSILASIGGVIAPVFAPLGFGNWQSATATLTGLIAKENVASTFGVLLGLGEAAEGNPLLLSQISGMFSASGAYAFILFNMLCIPCAAAVGAIKSEMGSWKWLGITLLFQTGTAYLVAFLIYQVGSAIFHQGNVWGAVLAVAIVAAVITYVLVSAKLRSHRRNPK